MSCGRDHFEPIDLGPSPEELAERRRILGLPEPAPARLKGTWGGRRPGAGAPKGNLNALKHGRFSRYQRDMIEAILQVPELRDVMVAISKRQRAQRRRAEQGAAALMSELLRQTGSLALHGDDHLEDIQQFLAAIRTAEAEIEKILEKQSSKNPRKTKTIKRRSRSRRLPAHPEPDRPLRLSEGEARVIGPRTPRRASVWTGDLSAEEEGAGG